MAEPDAPLPAMEAGIAAEVPAETDEVSSEIAPEPPEALPLAAEPAIVLADAATLEVHVDPIEAEEVVSPAPALASPAPAVDSVAAMPAIDTEYWRTAPGIETETSLETEDEECGSLTSGMDALAAPVEEVEEAVAEAPAVPQEAASEPETIAAPETEPAAEENEQGTAYAAIAGTEGASETLFPGAAGAAEDSEEIDPRRHALRTASRRSPATPPERIEINVPQPVFDFVPASALPEHPQDHQVPVADLRERRTSGVIDAVILALTVAGFFLAFRLAGGEIALSRVGAAVVVVASFLIYAQYFLLFTVTAGATPGMMLRGLRVVCFDGTVPGSLELGWRAFGCLLSAAAGMLGFIWAAWDEDGLTWHDRISQTYITYAEVEPLPIPASVH